MQHKHDAFLITNRPTIPLGQAHNPEVLAPKLAELIERLEGTAQSWKGVNSPNDAERAYNEGIVAEFERVITGLAKLNTQANKPGQLLKQLDELVGQLGQDWETMEKRRLEMTLDAATYYSEQNGRDRMVQTGRVHGLKEVIGPIRWFHYESA